MLLTNIPDQAEQMMNLQLCLEYVAFYQKKAIISDNEEFNEEILYPKIIHYIDEALTAADNFMKLHSKNNYA